MFFWLSLTPSLLPRTALFQGLLSGLTAMLGYGFGTAGSALIRTRLRREPSARAKRIAWRALAAAAIGGSIVMLWRGARWDEELRKLVGADPEGRGGPLLTVIGLLVMAGLILLGARVIRLFGRFLVRVAGRFVPARVAAIVGVVVATLLIVGFAQGVLWRGAISGMNSLSSVADGGTDEGAQRPSSALRAGSPDSLVAWDDLGRMGRRFVGLGPSPNDLQGFYDGDCCEEPIRVYVGLKAADSAEQRADLAVRELERTGAFEREVLVVYTPTGTGWINPRASAAIEYLHRGETAQVAMQYSYLPSWMSFLVDQTKAGEAGDALINAVLTRVEAIPERERPKVLLFGESLGSYGTEHAFGAVDKLRADVDGALLVGPTFSNPIWDDLTDSREAGSPQWLPTTNQAGVHFARTPADLSGVAGGDDGGTVVYLQNSSDPITWWNARLAFKKPDWAGDPAAPDRAPGFRWVPLVTFWQGAFDLVDSLGVPTGYGHNFGSNVVDGWVAILPPDGWTAADTARLKERVYDEAG